MQDLHVLKGEKKASGCFSQFSNFVETAVLLFMVEQHQRASIHIDLLDMDNLVTFEEGLKLRHKISEVALAFWILPRNKF